MVNKKYKIENSIPRFLNGRLLNVTKSNLTQQFIRNLDLNYFQSMLIDLLHKKYLN